MKIKTTWFRFDVHSSDLDWLTESDLLSWWRKVQTTSAHRTGDGHSKGPIMGIEITSQDDLVERFVVHVALPKGLIGKKIRDQVLSISETVSVHVDVEESSVDRDEFCDRYDVTLDESRLVEA